MRPTWSKVYPDALIHPNDRKNARRNVDLKIDERFLVPVEKRYNRAQLDRIQNAIRFTRKMRGDE